MRLGRYADIIAGGKNVSAYIPPNLPPTPPIDLERLWKSHALAERALGRLDGVSLMLPQPELFIYMYVRKEAVVSSQIEGTQSTLSDLLRFDAGAQTGQPFDDIREVSNYVAAMMHGLERLAELPLSLRLIREMHDRLLRDGRGSNKSPGEFRRSQNWIGGTKPSNALFVPPPVHELESCLGALENFIHCEDDGLMPLIKAGMLHVQFETIHPFLDGNGRIGRLLVTLYLCSTGVIKKPLLYLSLYLKSNRTEYYKLLQKVREEGAWEDWLEFFLNGIAETANQAFEAATQMVHLFLGDRKRISENLDRNASTQRVYDALLINPYATVKLLRDKTNLTAPTINTVLGDLEKLGIISEITGRKRDRVFAYQSYIDILNSGTTPLPK